MSFERLSSSARKLLYEMVHSGNPTVYLNNLLDKYSAEENQGTRAVLQELLDKQYISINWANNKPYIVNVCDSGRAYEELLAEYEQDISQNRSTVINIGDNNTFKKSPINIGDSKAKTQNSLTGAIL